MTTKNDNKTSLPIIRIKDGWLLRSQVSKHLHELWGRNSKLANDKDMQRIVGKYQAAWQPLEQKIMTGMTETVGLSFAQNIIDVYIAPWFRAFSDPMIIGVIYSPDEFIDHLTHELLHRLLTDNTTLPYQTQMLTEWQKLFNLHNHNFGLIVHIPVHAIHKAIYLDILKAPDRLKRNVVNCNKYNATDYIKAWDYVEQHGYKQIIEQLKESYKELADKI